jgi:alkaline phosphatase D
MILIPLSQIWSSEIDVPKYERYHWWYRGRRSATRELVNVIREEPDKAIANALLHKDDAEAYFIVAAAYAKKNEIEKAMAYVEEAVSAGLPIERFLAGPRTILAPLIESDEFKKLIAEKGISLVHGPLLGDVTEARAKIWVRTASELPVQVKYSKSRDMKEAMLSCVVSTQQDKDFTAIVELDGLEPEAEYFYELIIGNKEGGKVYSFRTFPEKGKPARFEVAFGGGAAYILWHSHMWQTIARNNPAALLLLGDNVYIDHPALQEIQRYHYYRRQSEPFFRELISTTPVYAIWDDHDFAANDMGVGPARDKPWWKIPNWKVFKNNWNNPYYGGGEAHPGCWFDFSIGAVDFFMLDGRYYREKSPEGKDDASMLGPCQKAWLLDKLKTSQAVFKVIASPVPFSQNTKPRSRDTWDGYPKEREEIFTFIEENKIDGVFLIAADRHRSDARKTERANGYPLYEFESSKITNQHTHPLLAGCLFGYNEKNSFGKLSFDTARDDPCVKFSIVNIDNDIKGQMTLRLSEISHKK